MLYCPSSYALFPTLFHSFSYPFHTLKRYFNPRIHIIYIYKPNAIVKPKVQYRHHVNACIDNYAHFFDKSNKHL